MLDDIGGVTTDPEQYKQLLMQEQMSGMGGNGAKQKFLTPCAAERASNGPPDAQR